MIDNLDGGDPGRRSSNFRIINLGDGIGSVMAEGISPILPGTRPQPGQARWCLQGDPSKPESMPLPRIAPPRKESSLNSGGLEFNAGFTDPQKKDEPAAKPMEPSKDAPITSRHLATRSSSIATIRRCLDLAQELVRLYMSTSATPRRFRGQPLSMLQCRGDRRPHR